MADIVTLVLRDHARIRRMFAELDEVRDDTIRLGRLWPELAWLLTAHVDAAEEIVRLPVLGGGAGGPAALREVTDIDDDIREAVAEARLQPAGSLRWRLAVRAARAAADQHIEVIESGPLPRFRRRAPGRVRVILGRHWTAFMAARRRDGRDSEAIRLPRQTGTRGGG
jgi:hypothetical protein